MFLPMKNIMNIYRKQVTCLCVSMDGTALVSGSHDFDVRVWDISSRQCIRTIPHKGITERSIQINNLANLSRLLVLLDQSTLSKHKTIQFNAQFMFTQYPSASRLI